MRFKLFNERGFTLTELLAATILVSLLAVGFATAMLQFVIGYQESRDFYRLQQDMLKVMDAIRHGYFVRGIHTQTYMQYPLIGLLTAQQVTISYLGDTITMFPVESGLGIGRQQWVRIKRDNATGQVLLDYQYLNQSGANIVIFPSVKAKAGRENKFRMTNLRFTNLTPGEEMTKLIRVTMEGQVRHRIRNRSINGRLQSQVLDQQLNIRKVAFETTVFIGNADKDKIEEPEEEE
jgi:prepilin-type N-terminal cleavage/methylation domain-containing protein